MKRTHYQSRNIDDSIKQGKSSDVNILGLNICGLHKKIEYGIFDKYVKNFDFICVSETKTDNVDADCLSGFKVAYKNNTFNMFKNQSSAAVHGIAIFYREKLGNKVHIVNDLSSNCVLWVKIDQTAFGFEFVLGSVYIPHEGSKYHSKEMFDILEDDIVNIKSRFNNIPICLVGDFNSRTGLLDDFVCFDDVTCHGIRDGIDTSIINDELANTKYDLESLGICTDRHNSDKCTNNNGYRLIELCKSLDVHIVNGRFGDDFEVGKMTCDNSSTIDYVIASSEFFPKVSNFHVDIFDKLLSDKHNPICLSLSFKNTVECQPTSVDEKHCDDNETDLFLNARTVIANNWNRSHSLEYKEAYKETDIDKLASIIDDVVPNSTDQKTIDDLASEICQALINPAFSTGLAKQRTNMTRRGHKSPSKLNSNSWFGKDCQKLRSEYFKVKNRFKKLKTQDAKEDLRVVCSRYKKTVRKAKRDFTRKFHNNIRNLKKSNSTEYWKVLNKASGQETKMGNIKTSAFLQHFSKLNQMANTKSNSFDPRKISFDLNEEINKPISESEIWVQIKNLKNNKSAGIDFVTNELLKNCPDSMITIICNYFNLVLNTGIVPSDWTKGIIKPIFKNKGSIDDPDNYRGITLLSCIGKLFTSVVNKRLSDYVEATGILGEEQAGFREGYSTLDHIFVLYSIIDLYLHKKKRIYCAFIDYKKAFDLIDRTSLWSKLISSGINGKVITVIYNMYNNAKSCVMNGYQKSNFFNCNVGVRQGENLSPLLFAMYLNDFELFISKRFSGLSSISNDIKTYLSDDDVEVFLKLFTLLYADDTIVFAESETELQQALDAVYDYCKTWHLTVNTSKTKITVFSRGKVRKYPDFKFGTSSIEVVDDFNYLGVKFNYNNKFKKGINKQVNQARRAMFSLISKARKLELPIDIQLELFDQLVGPILLYGCEIWGFDNLSHIEQFHLKFCKQILQVNTSTANCMVLGELGRNELRVSIEMRMISFWHKIACSKSHKLSNIIYRLMKTLFDKGIYQSPWLMEIKSTLDNIGLSYLWNCDLSFVSKSWLKNNVRLKLSDIFSQTWNEEVMKNSHCTNYRIFKNSLQIEKYITTLDKKDRISFCKFRCGNHKLPIVTGRYQGIAKEDRLCSLCNSHQLGDEFHYLFECSSLYDKRQMYIKPYYRQRPNALKMHALLNTQDDSELVNLAKFCTCIMNKFN